ncbi:reverse transcriptase [Gossypium australe]|uniref:Reverse transcriptase n=1 Tax=Gossypium australe TaxID=47621 RepID=A0A5B6V888_9ROSI|nr:reverse transcriptase [Gossypium australe]
MRNTIQSLRHEDGRKTSDEGEMENIARNYFQNLFLLKGFGNTDHILFGIKICVSKEVNSKLIAKYMKEEVIVALKEMGPTKVFEDDGFLALFFQQFWHIVESDVVDFCLGVLKKACLWNLLIFTSDELREF